MQGSYFTITHTGMVRAGNEDSFFARPPVFMVADGMGGAQAGEVASAEAASAFASFKPPEEHPESELAELITQINGSIHEMAEKDTGRAGMGTTVTAAAVSGNTVGIAHVGDSRAYRWRDGRLEQLTEDHSLVGEMLRQGRITEEEAETHPQRSVITRALGIETGVEVDTASVPWAAGDVFLLCSDGLSSMVADEEIAEILEGSTDMQAAGEKLVEAANVHGGRDNITAVLFAPGALAEESGETVTTETCVAPAVGERPWFKSCAFRGVLVAFVGLLLVGGAWFANSLVYYVGAQGDYLAIYQGVPLEVGPLSFSSLQSVSEVRLEDLEPFERERVDRQELKSKSGAEQILENYSGRVEDKKQEEERTSRTATIGTSTGGGR